MQFPSQHEKSQAHLRTSVAGQKSSGQQPFPGRHKDKANAILLQKNLPVSQQTGSGTSDTFTLNNADGLFFQ